MNIYLKIVIYGNLLKDLFRSFSEIFSQDPFSVLRCPYQMIFRIIDRMRNPFQFHTVGIAYVSLFSAGELFIPVSQRAWIFRFN